MERRAILRISLKWNYGEGYVDISMRNYVHKQLIKYRHSNQNDRNTAHMTLHLYNTVESHRKLQSKWKVKPSIRKENYAYNK